MTGTAAVRRGEDTDRTGLRTAIEAAEAARAHLVAHEAAIEKARALVQTSADKYEAALTELASVKARYAGAVAAHAGGTKHTPPSGIHEARLLVEAAEDEDEAAGVALKQLIAHLPAITMANWQAEADVEVKIEALLAPVARDLVVAAQKLESELAIRYAALGVVLERELLKRAPDELKHFDLRRQCDAVFDDELRQKIVKLSRPPSETNKQIALETANAWRQAREAMRVDANARLPEIG